MFGIRPPFRELKLAIACRRKTIGVTGRGT
jgi:hypothetical protein